MIFVIINNYFVTIIIIYMAKLLQSDMGQEKSNIADQSIVNTSNSSHVVFAFHVAQKT